jgi:hypothetical protein
MIYNFEFDQSTNPTKLTDQRFDQKDEDGRLQRRPATSAIPTAIDAEKRTTLWFERQNVNLPEEIREFLPIGYRTMDRGLKNYFSGIQVPTKDGIKMMGVRISGGDKPYLVWAQDLRLGRVTLPVMSVRRENDEFNFQKFSPAHFHWMSKRFLDPEGTRIALAYRPIPSLINYSLSVWAEHKRDLEYINYQVRTRFNPVAEFMVEDEHMRGSVFLKYSGMTVSVDDEMPPDQRANKRYDYSIQMEGWLPIPEKVVPSILGRVMSLKDGTKSLVTGEILDVVLGKDVLNTAQVRKLSE